MRHLFSPLLFAVMTFLMAACSGSDHFTVQVKTPADLQRMVVFTYNDGRGIVQTTVPVEDGHARFEGHSSALTLLTLALTDGTPIADCLVSDGDKVSVSFALDPDGSGRFTAAEIDGNRATKRLHNFMAENDSLIAAGYSSGLNNAVAGYIRAHSDDPVSTVLLTRYYDACDNHTGADSLLTAIVPAARPMTLLGNYGAVTGTQLDTSVGSRLYAFTIFTPTDSFLTIRPTDSRQTLFAFLPGGRRRAAAVDSLRALWEQRDTLRLRVVEISLNGDSARWRAEIAPDSTKWLHAWAPGNVTASAIRRMAVPRQPFYVLMDSTGRQIYRGSDMAAARREAFANLVRRTYTAQAD